MRDCECIPKISWNFPLLVAAFWFWAVPVGVDVSVDDLTNFPILIPMASDKVVGGPCPRVHVLERMSLVYVMKAYMDNTHGGTMTRIKYFFSMKPLKKPVYCLI